MKYTKRSVVIEAIQYTGDLKAVIAWVNAVSPAWAYRVSGMAGTDFCIETLEGNMVVREGDFVVCGVDGELYPVKPHIFEKTYVPVDAET